MEHVQREGVIGLCSMTHYKGSSLGHTRFHIHTNDTDWALTKLAHGKMGDTSDLLKGRTSIQRAPGICWQNIVKFDEDKVLHYRLGTDWLNDKGLGVQVGRAKHESPVLAGSHEG